MAKKTTRNQKQAEQAARKRRHIRIIAGIILFALEKNGTLKSMQNALNK